MAKTKTGKFQKGTSGNPKGRPKKAMTRAVKDGWHSLLTGVGVLGKDKRQQTDFYADEISYDLARHLWRGDDIAAKAVDVPTDEMTRAGFDFSIQDDMDNAKGLQEEVEKKWKELGAINAFAEALSYERAYGGSAILIGALDGVADMAKPLNVDRVRGIDFLTVLENQELLPYQYYANPRAPKYGKVATYRLAPVSPGTSVDDDMDVFANFVIHETRLIVFPGIRVTRQNIGNKEGWGDSIYTRMWRVLRDFNTAWDGTGLLVSDFAQAVFKMKDLALLLGQSDGEEKLEKRLRALALGMSTARAIVIDEEESYDRVNTPISGYADLLREFMARMAAATDMPIIKLFGTGPSGLNADGGAEIRMWYDKISSMQEKKVLPGMEYLTRIILKSMGKDLKKWSVEARALWQPTDEESAESRNKQAQTDQIYINTGVLSPHEVTMSRFGGDAYSYETVVDFSERDELEPIVAPAAAMQAALLESKSGDGPKPQGEDQSTPEEAGKE